MSVYNLKHAACIQAYTLRMSNALWQCNVEGAFQCVKAHIQVALTDSFSWFFICLFFMFYHASKPVHIILNLAD